MKKKLKVWTFVMAAAMCTSLLAACSSSPSSKSSSETDSSSGSVSNSSSEASDSMLVNSESSSSSEDMVEPSEDLIGKVSQISDTAITIAVYIPEGKVDDYTTVDLNGLTASDTTESIYVDSNTEYYIISSGTQTEAEADDIAEGDLIAERTTAEGIQQILILDKAGEEGGEPDASKEDEPLEVKIAEVTAIADNTLSLKLYSLSSSAADYQITDTASIEMANYEDSGQTEEFNLSSETTVKECKDGAAVDMEPSGIAAGDMLAVYTDASGVETIMVYHKAD